MRRNFTIAVLASLLLGPFIRSASADSLVSDISEHEIEVHYNFTSRDLLLFGAIDHTGPDHHQSDFDVVVVVKGPERPIVVRKKDNVAGVWLNKDSYTFENIPGYYAIAYSRPLTEIASEDVLKELGLGFDYIGSSGEKVTDEAIGGEVAASEVGEDNASSAIDVESFRLGLLRNKERMGLYLDVSTNMQIMGNTLFRSEFHFPSNVPVGPYEARIYLFQGGQLIAEQDSPLNVNKRGFAQSVYTLAHEHSAVYGIIAILLALAAGWLAGVVSRR